MMPGLAIRESIASGQVEGAELRILAAILASQHACPSVASVLALATVGLRRGVAVRALRGLVRDGWVVLWQTGPGAVRLVTLTPWGAEQLDHALIQPERDEETEPTWGIAGIEPGGMYDEPPDECGRPPGLYTDEPLHFVVEDVWHDSEGTPKGRSLSRYEKIAAAREKRKAKEDAIALERKRNEATKTVVCDAEGEPVLLFGRTVPVDRRIGGRRTHNLTGAAK